MKTSVNTILQGDALYLLSTLEDESVSCIVTSPPYYGLRDYGISGQVGKEGSADDYISKLVAIFSQCKRVLKSDGTLWLNIGDTYNQSGKGATRNLSAEWTSKTMNTSILKGGHLRMAKEEGCKPKDLIGIPWMLAFALRADGWYLRQDIIWHKPNPMPESVKDRCTKSHEYIFLLSKSSKYYFDHKAISEQAVTKDSIVRNRDDTKLNNTPGRTKMKGLKTNNYETRNKRSVWSVSTKPFKEAHFATFPESLIIDCIKAGCPEGGIVLDPFFGAGTTGVVARKLNRNFIGIELNPEYIEIAKKRIIEHQKQPHHENTTTNPATAGNL